jgi:hypothetical protein
MNTIILSPCFAIIPTTVRAILLAGLTLSLLTTCDHGETVPVSTCRLTGITEVRRNSGVSNPTDSLLTTYEYNDKGQLRSYARRDAASNNPNSYSELYTYDANGNLMVRETNTRRTDDKYTYIHTDGRLTSIVTSSFIYNFSNVSSTFEYDAAGNLIRIGGATFVDGKQTGFARTSGPAYTFENGRVKQQFNDAGILLGTYQYDAQGRLTREDRYAGVVTNYVTFEYINGKTASQALPSFKGIPDQYTNLNSTGVEGLPSKISSYINYGDGIDRLTRITTHNYSFNTSGFPVKRSTVNTNYLLDGSTDFSSSGETTYLYANCP